MANSFAQTRRRFQFSLRTLLIVVTLLAVPLGYVGWQAKIVRERKAMIAGLRAAEWNHLTFGAFTADDFAPRDLPSYSGVWAVRLPDPELVARRDATQAPSFLRSIFGDEEIYAICLPMETSDVDVKRFEQSFPEAIVCKRD